MKCGAYFSKQVEEINISKSIFPKQYETCSDAENKEYLIMDRLDGDITYFFYNYLVDYVLIDCDNKQLIKKVFS